MVAPNETVCARALDVAQMVVTEGLGEGRPAHGFFIIVGDTNEILADERRDPQRRNIKLCKYGDFKTYLDRRSEDLRIGDCLNDDDRSFLNLLHEDGAVVVDGQSGQVCCGGFFVNDSTSGIGIGGARTKAASAMATQANGCYVILASETICGSASRPPPPNAALRVFDRTNTPRPVPVLVNAQQQEQIRAPRPEPVNMHQQERTQGRNTVQFNFGGAQILGGSFLGSTEGGDANYYA